MASIISISDGVHIYCMKNFQISNTDDISGEPYLILAFFYYINGERVDAIEAESHFRFSECNSSSLRAFIEENESLPLYMMVDPEDVEVARERMSNIVASLVHDCIGVEGLKTLQVEIIVEINDEVEEDCLLM